MRLEGMGDQYVGQEFKYAHMPRKKKREHRWIGMATYTLTAEDATAVYDPSKDVYFNTSKLVQLVVACVDCEEAYKDAYNHPCLAEEFPWQQI